VQQRALPFVRQLRGTRPETPIVLSEDAVGMDTSLNPAMRQHYQTNHAALRTAFDTLGKEGAKGLTYIEGSAFLGTDGEATVDGVHPTDLGFLRYADAYEPVLRRVLKLI
jgi:hypothetical protein